MSVPTRRGLQSPNYDLLDLGIADLAGRSGSRLVIESFQANLQESGPPLAHHAQRAAQFLGHRLVIKSLAAGQYHPCPPSLGWLDTRAMSQRLKTLLLIRSQDQRFFRASGSHLSFLHLRRNPFIYSSHISVTGD